MALTRRSALKMLASGSIGLGAAVHGEMPAFAQAKPSTIRVAMSASDIPLTTGQPSQGVEGIRFIGLTVYDGLTR